MTTSRRSTLIASGIGTFIEWYDFFLFGTASALVFNKLFFPQFDPRVGTLLALLTYATGFLARPLGGLVSGHFGDRIGRKKVLLGTLLAMGGATFLMGLVPTYEHIGIWGAVILVLLRMIQGFAAGGEWSGALVLVAETIEPGKRGFWGSMLTAVNQASFITGAFILTTINRFVSEAQFLAWGWRVPFLLSILMVGVGLYIRLKVQESPEFAQVERRKETVSAPVVEVFKNPRNVLSVLAIRVGENTFYYATSVFAISYAVGMLQVSRTVVLDAITLGAALAVVGSLVGGLLADRFGSRAVMLVGFVFQIVWIIPFFYLYETRQPALITLATVAALLVVNSAVDAPQAKFMTPLFPAKVRYSGVAAGREIATVVGGLTPAIAAALIGLNNTPWLFAGFLLACSLIGLVGLLSARPAVGAGARELDVPPASAARVRARP